MRLPLLAAGLTMSMAGAALAQSAVGGTTSTASVADLVAEGYEIKAAVPNGAKYVVFLQKDRKAYACEFVNLTASRCGEIK
ncbi:hypothetical protein DFR52_1011033 [Hoeflea marina]|uniref:YpeB-like protein with protease inhibitory function n=1 Tax=Hoeflea marina TaxID=274592 RepID=A0A317PS94_9HYPH|nr:hypothetical protein [Hoeflea marina]PWW04338.1 hypothetical protein DFR52_1011033 [Hoeflea marina]